MLSRKHPRLEAFLSLAWYEVFLRFVANFVAKSAELLLAAGLVVSTANFLTDGEVLVTGSAAFEAWSWIQSLAIDSSLGISFYYVLYCLKQRDWVKFTLYSVLTVILTLVAGIITDGDIFSHANQTPIHEAMTMLGIDVRLLSVLRSIAVVGFVLMSRLRDVSFKDLSEPAAPQHGTLSTNHVTLEPSAVTVPTATPKEGGTTHLTIEDVALLLQVLTQSHGTRITQDLPGSLQLPNPALALQATPKEPSHPFLAKLATHVEQQPTSMEPSATSPVPNSASSIVPVPSAPQAMEPVPSDLHQSRSSKEPVPEPVPVMLNGEPQIPKQVDMGVDREERLEHAYQALLLEGHVISARRLAERAHVHRSTCIEWLRLRQQEGNGSHAPQQLVQEQEANGQSQMHASQPEQESAQPELEQHQEEE
jgi:hypothetical protein